MHSKPLTTNMLIQFGEVFFESKLWEFAKALYDLSTELWPYVKIWYTGLKYC